MADPTPAEVAAAIATLEAFEHAQHVEPVSAPAPAVAAAIVGSPTAPAPAATVVAVDPYLARSVKSSPNGF